MTRPLLFAAAFAVLGFCAVADAQSGSGPQYGRDGAARATGDGSGYEVNRYGYGNYVPGPNGSYGGYPAGSAGAIELQNEQREKCNYAPETC